MNRMFTGLNCNIRINYFECECECESNIIQKTKNFDHATLLLNNSGMEGGKKFWYVL